MQSIIEEKYKYSERLGRLVPKKTIPDALERIGDIRRTSSKRNISIISYRSVMRKFHTSLSVVMDVVAFLLIIAAALAWGIFFRVAM